MLGRKPAIGLFGVCLLCASAAVGEAAAGGKKRGTHAALAGSGDVPRVVASRGIAGGASGPSTASVSVGNLDCDGVGNACLTFGFFGGPLASIPAQGSINVLNPITRGILEGFFGTTNCTIARSKVAVELTHGDVGDLGLFLHKEAPGQTVDLYTPPSACNATALDATFRDGSPGAAANTCPFTGGGLLRPVEPLSTFNGQSVRDTFILQVTDFFAGDAGNLQRFAQAWDLNCSPLNTPHVCNPSSTALCLQDDRFRVTAEYRTGDGSNGPGQIFPMTADSGAFTFFGPDNVEIVVKVLNGCGLNNKYWVFLAGLTNVRVYVTVVDILEGTALTFVNPLGRDFESVYHTSAFDC